MSLEVDIRKKFKGFELHNAFSAGTETLGLLGASGCGKSLTMRSIAGIERPDSGKIVVNGTVFFDRAPGKKPKVDLTPQQRKTALLFQNYMLFPNLTVAQNVAAGIGKDVSAADRDAAVACELKRFGLEGFDKRYPAQLSGGQQQRVALARMLAARPGILMLDEPFSALDAKIRQQMREELKKIQSDLGITVVFVTHDQEEAMSLSHRIVVMNKGKFEQIGTPTEIYDKPATRHVASFIGEMNFIDKGDKTIAVRPEDVTVSLDGSGDFTGTVRTIMVLGHYVVVNVQHGENVIKCFVDRDISEKLSVGQSVGMHIGKHTVFDK